MHDNNNNGALWGQPPLWGAYMPVLAPHGAAVRGGQQEVEEEEEEEEEEQGNRGPPRRRQRTFFTLEEREALYQSFRESQYASREEINRLHALLGKPKDKLRMWFANRRRDMRNRIKERHGDETVTELIRSQSDDPKLLRRMLNSDGNGRREDAVQGLFQLRLGGEGTAEKGAEGRSSPSAAVGMGLQLPLGAAGLSERSRSLSSPSSPPQWRSAREMRSGPGGATVGPPSKWHKCTYLDIVVNRGPEEEEDEDEEEESWEEDEEDEEEEEEEEEEEGSEYQLEEDEEEDEEDEDFTMDLD